MTKMPLVKLVGQAGASVDNGDQDDSKYNQIEDDSKDQVCHLVIWVWVFRAVHGSTATQPEDGKCKVVHQDVILGLGINLN